MSLLNRLWWWLYYDWRVRRRMARNLQQIYARALESGEMGGWE